MANESTSFVLSDRMYNAMKRFVQVVLPSISSLYFGLAKIWGLPAAENVCGTCALVATFLGVTLGISNSNYHSSGAAYDGTVQVVGNDDGSAVHFNVDPNDLVDKKSVRLKVSPPKL